MPARLRKAPTKRETGHSKAVTLEDVALAAGVTSMTVSRAIKGHNEIAPATRDRVLRIARELNYTANLSARALATGKTGIIAVISGSLNQYYYANIVHLLESQITKSGYQMRLLHTDSDLHHLVTSTNASAVDGVIVAGQHQLFGKLRQLAPQVFNLCVFIDTSKNPETDYIHSNVGSALDEGLKLMLAAGRQHQL
ncbi:LacI family transcriptional regulator [bacterium]|nr:MAG: LacI family transcriptional regulator [bacterium]